MQRYRFPRSHFRHSRQYLILFLYALRCSPLPPLLHSSLLLPPSLATVFHTNHTHTHTHTHSLWRHVRCSDLSLLGVLAVCPALFFLSCFTHSPSLHLSSSSLCLSVYWSICFSNLLLSSPSLILSSVACLPCYCILLSLYPFSARFCTSTFLPLFHPLLL